MKIRRLFNIAFNHNSQQRLWAIFILAIILILFSFLASINAGWIKAYQFFNPCGFKQDYKIPCPTCGFTRSALAFSRGEFAKSFYIQPAAAVFCCSMVIIAIFALLIGVFGLKFAFIDHILAKFKIGYVIILILMIFAGGWAVMLARELAK